MHHAAERLALAIVSATASPADYPTVPLWARACRPAVSGRGMNGWCAAAGVQPHDARDFSRLLRSVLLSEEDGWSPTEFLDIVNPRTATRLLERGRCLELRGPGQCSVEDFCRIQRFVRNRHVIEAVLRLTRRHGPGPSSPESPGSKLFTLTAILTSALTADLTIASVAQLLCF